MADDRPRYPDEPAHSRPRHDRDRSFPATIKRVSWGAIFAGAVVAIVIQLMLNLLGMGLGFSAIDPVQEADPLSGLGTASIIYLIIATLIALCAGGWVAGRLAGIPRRFDGAIHGFVAWGLATLVSFYLITSAVGSIISGSVGLVGQGLETAGQGVAAVVPDDVAEQLLQDVTLQDIQQEARQILREAELQQGVEQAADTAQAEVEGAARTPGTAEQNLDRALEQLMETGQNADRENVVNILVARTDMNREEARRTVRQYEERYQQARQRASQTLDSLRQTATEVSGEATDVLSTVGWVAFLAMLLGAIAAAGGGAAGSPRDLPASPAVRRE